MKWKELKGEGEIQSCVRQHFDRGRSPRSGGSRYLCISDVKLIAFITSSQEPTELTCIFTLTYSHLHVPAKCPTKHTHQKKNGPGGIEVFEMKFQNSACRLFIGAVTLCALSFRGLRNKSKKIYSHSSKINCITRP